MIIKMREFWRNCHIHIVYKILPIKYNSSVDIYFYRRRFIFLFVLSSTVIKRVLNTKVADEEHLKMPKSEIYIAWLFPKIDCKEAINPEYIATEF